LSNGRTLTVERHSWTLTEDGKKRAEVVQLPLRLAWAITIHKSQGMSLDAAEIDLGKSFTPGMGYVALSRVRTLDGIYLTGINAMAMQLHPDIFEFDAELRAASELLAAEVADALEEAEEPEFEAPQLNEELLQKLKSWRIKRALADQVPAYIIAHDKTLEALTLRPPATPQQLLATPGFGPAKAEKYGPEILEITREYAAETAEVAEAPTTETPNAEAADARDEKAKGLLKELTNPATLEDDPPQAGEAVDWFERYRDELRARYPRSGQGWKPEEDAQLVGLFNSGASLGQVCDALNRPPGGVWARLVVLLRAAVVG
jgi:hypothetical protein